jgi:hypothetical protein
VTIAAAATAITPTDRRTRFFAPDDLNDMESSSTARYYVYVMFTNGRLLKRFSSVGTGPVCIWPHEENPETDLKKEWSPRRQGWKPRTNAGLFAHNSDTFVPEYVDQRRIIHGHKSLESLAGLKAALDIGSGYRNLSHVVMFNFLKESAEGHRLSASD